MLIQRNNLRDWKPCGSTHGNNSDMRVKSKHNSWLQQMHAWAEVCHLSQSSKSVFTCFFSRRMQYWLKNNWPDQALFKHSLHTNCISNSAILHNNYILLVSDLCACVHVKKKWRHKGGHSSSVSSSNRLVRLQTWKKSDGLVHCSVENAAVCAKAIVKGWRNLN